MNRKNSEKDWSGLAFVVKLAGLVMAFAYIFFLVGKSHQTRSDPQYRVLEELRSELTFANGQLVIASDASNPDSMGISPIECQDKANKAFIELERVAAVTPAKFVSLRVRQALKDGPMKLYELPKESVVTSRNADGQK